MSNGLFTFYTSQPSLTFKTCWDLILTYWGLIKLKTRIKQFIKNVNNSHLSLCIHYKLTYAFVTLDRNFTCCRRGKKFITINILVLSSEPVSLYFKYRFLGILYFFMEICLCFDFILVSLIALTILF